LFNDYLGAMPGVSFSPHGARYAFATYGERDLGFKPGEGGIILDHLEGVEPNDVTGQFYSSDPQIARKRQMMRAWTEWCEVWGGEGDLGGPRPPRPPAYDGGDQKAALQNQIAAVR
jgi:hypothetical protein